MLVYRRYVDDTVILCNVINNGWSYDKNKNEMVYSEVSDELDDEVRTMNILSEIANSINPNIQMTTDFPSKHENSMMPVLDLNMWIGTDEKGCPRVCHKCPVFLQYLIGLLCLCL